MGLDMTLSKKHYVKNWSHNDKKDQYSVIVKKGGKKFEDIDTKKISNIEEEVMYWRKANAIHKFFVDKAQGGTDDCRDAYIEEDVLEELLSHCEAILASTELVSGTINNGYGYKKNEVTGEMERYENTQEGKVLKDSSVAHKLLPTTSGFFFGGTDYDEYYWQDIQETAEMLRKEKAGGWVGDYYYHSSW